MNILVTGGAGFIGSNIVDAYIALGHRVIVVDNLSRGKRENLHPRTIFYHCDINDPDLARIFEREEVDVVNHHAAQMDVRKSVEDPRYDATINILGVLNLLELCRKHHVKKVIFASTGGAIYGEQDYFPANEDHPLRPLSPYGITKLATEKYLFYYGAVHGLRHVILRYANVYGPRQSPVGEAGVVAIFATRLLRNEQSYINGDGSQTRDYVFVGDVVRANVNALEFENSDVFNIGTGKETDVNTLFRRMKSLIGSTCAEQHHPAKTGEQLRSVLTAAKAKSILRWEQHVELDEGLSQTIDYFRNQERPST